MYVSIGYHYTEFVLIKSMLQSVDLTELARNGKLDPTIGRDEGACDILIF